VIVKRLLDSGGDGEYSVDDMLIDVLISDNEEGENSIQDSL
jgi:hypothetical protein